MVDRGILLNEAWAAWGKCDITDEQLKFLRDEVNSTMTTLYLLGERGALPTKLLLLLDTIDDMISQRKQHKLRFSS